MQQVTRRREVLALDIGGTKLAAGLVDAEGKVRARRVIATERAAGAEEVLGRALDLLEQTRAAQGGAGEPEALGVSTNGLTREDRVELAPAVAGWERLQIPRELRSRFPGLPVTIVNDVKAAAAAEMRWGALRGVAEGLYVNLGTGFAVAIVSRGRLLSGAHGAAGEVGYIVPDLAALAGRHVGQAVLEERLGGRGVEIWTESELGYSVSAADLLALVAEPAREGGGAEPDQPARELGERLLDEISLWIANVATVTDPARIVLGGGFLRSVPGLCQRVQATIGAVAPFPAEVRPAHFGAESALLGAGAVALPDGPQIESPAGQA